MERAQSPGSAEAPAAGRTSTRERRVDVLRGVALLCIFADHMPGNWLNWITLRNFGLSDAAELFVMLSGFASMVAFGRSFQRDGARAGLLRIALRCLRLYIFQIGMLLVMLATVWLWSLHYPLVPAPVAPIIRGGAAGIRRGLTLQAQSSNLNILPLYILLLAVFPAIYAGLRSRPALTMIVSAGVWLAANLVPGFNLTNAMDGNGWFFNPFAWQFLFVIGAVGALLLRRYDGNLPHPLWLRAAAWGYLGFALIAVAPWETWGWFGFHPIVLDAPDKTVLAPLRLLNVLALAALALSSARFRTLAERPALRLLAVCGRNSLEVFVLATMLAMIFRLVFRTFGVTVTTQVLANGIGLALMIALALVLEHYRRPTAAKRDTAKLDSAQSGSVKLETVAPDTPKLGTTTLGTTTPGRGQQTADMRLPTVSPTRTLANTTIL